MSERPGPPCPGFAPCAELTDARAEVERLQDQVEDLEGDLSRIVSARDLTIRDLRAALGEALVERDEAVAARDAFGQKAHQLQEQLTTLQHGLTLEGWWCPCEKTAMCQGVFNGALKERRSHCRCCGAPRPT